MHQLPERRRPGRAGPVAVLGAFLGTVAVGLGAIAWSPDLQQQTVVRAEQVDRTLVPAAGATPLGPGELPHGGLEPGRTGAMRAQIERVEVGPAAEIGAPPEGAFPEDPGDGPHACEVRNRILVRDLTSLRFRSGRAGCRVSGGELADPYLGQVITYREERADEVGIDRIVSLEYAWAHGAAAWTPETRRAFAGDLRNLVAVDARAIEHKAGRGPAAWLPPEVGVRCAYVARFAEVVDRYGLSMSPADQEVARRQC